MAAHVFEYNLMQYRRVWHGTLFLSFFSPLLFLAAMGLGLGGLVNRNSGGVAGMPYIDFLAPGLLVATAMQTAASESSYPILFRVFWGHIYDGIIATPMTVVRLVAGEALWQVFRLTTMGAAFWVVILLFGPGRTPSSILAIPVATLTGLAFALPIIAYTATITKGYGVFSALQRFVVTPLFLFGGTFFPIEKLPGLLQAIAWLTPIAHGTTLARELMNARPLGWIDLVHVAVVLAYAVVGFGAAYFNLDRRLHK